MRQYSQLFCLGLQIWISEMLQYHPELEAVELVQDGRDSSEIIYFQLHTCMYFSTSGGREVTTKRQLDGLCSLLKLTSHIPMFQDY
jgi:hypothetical protein